jgi:5-methylcytosine-specific restriction endonuclease McrA
MPRGKGLKRKPMKTKRRAPDPEWQAARFAVIERAGGCCEGRIDSVCVGRGHHVHHVLRRSQGGANDPALLLLLCEPCHTWTHANPDAARSRGLLRSPGGTPDEP